MFYRRSVLSLAFFIYRETEYWIGQHYLREKAKILSEELVAEFVLWENSNPKDIHALRINEILQELKNILLQARAKNLITRETFTFLSQDLQKIQERVSSKDISKNTESSASKQPKEEKPLSSSKMPNLSPLQKSLLSLLKEKGPLQVANLHPYFPNLTKRTLRRHLRFLVEKGLIIREGEGSHTVYKAL